MGIALLTAGDRLNRNTGPIITALTYCFWMKLDALYSAPRCYQRLTGTTGKKLELYTDTPSNGLILGFNMTGSAPVTSAATIIPLPVETWVHLAVTLYDHQGAPGPGKDATVFVDAVAKATITHNGAVAPFSFTSEALGYAVEYAANPANLTVAYYRSWANVLTAAEIAIERRSNIAIKTDKTILLSDTPLTARNNLQDVSGFQQHWALLGGVDDPGVFLNPWSINHFSLTPTAESHLGGRLT